MTVLVLLGMLLVLKMAALLGESHEIREDHPAETDMVERIDGACLNVLGVVVVQTSVKGRLHVVPWEHWLHVLRQFLHSHPLNLVEHSLQRRHFSIFGLRENPNFVKIWGDLVMVFLWSGVMMEENLYSRGPTAAWWTLANASPLVTWFPIAFSNANIKKQNKTENLNYIFPPYLLSNIYYPWFGKLSTLHPMLLSVYMIVN